MTDSPDSSEQSRHREMIDSLTRQTAAMERLADLLPQVIAQNQVFLRVLMDREDDEPSRYLDGERSSSPAGNPDLRTRQQSRFASPRPFRRHAIQHCWVALPSSELR